MSAEAVAHPSKQLPVPGEVFAVAGCAAFLISPAHVTAAGRAVPWVWYAPTLHGLPGAEERWMFQKFLAAGMAVAGIDVGESFGSPEGREMFTALYQELTGKRGFAPKPCLLARSRGGLMLYNWAVEHASSVCCIAGLYPVCDLASYPGLATACGVYSLTAEQLTAQLAQHNPLDRLEPLVEARVPICHIHGDRDTVVPLEKNSGELARRYRELGGEITLQVVKGGGHDYWTGWFQCQELVDFVIAHASRDRPSGSAAGKYVNRFERTKTMKSEKKTYVDRAAGVEVTQLTDYKGHSHHFYFTNAGWYAQGRKLLFASDRNNRTNLFGVDLETGETEQLTDLEPVPLPREVEFLRASKNPVREEVCFWHDLTLLCLDIPSRRIRTLLEIDPRWCVSMSNCSADGRHVYFGSWEDQSHKFEVDLLRGYVGFDQTWTEKPLSRVERVEVDTGRHEIVFEEQYWIGHVNTSPTQPEILTFCHEGHWDKVDNRIWGLDAGSGKVWKIRPAAPGEVVGHEYWFSDGHHVGYHGWHQERGHLLGNVRFDNTGAQDYGFPGQTGHIFSLDDQLIVGDGDGVIRIWRREGDGYSQPRLLCRHDSAMRIQQTHPHPRISPDGRYVVFSSDRSGYGNVYRVPLVAFDSLPLADPQPERS